MTLQTRLILVVMSTLLLVAVALIGLGWMAQNSVEERFRHATISRQDVLWRELVSGQLELMTASTSGLTRNEGALHALASGQLALGMLRTAAMRDEPYDLALLDMQMPGMDGLELARTIKADPALATLPLVMVTSITQRGHEELAQQAASPSISQSPCGSLTSSTASPWSRVQRRGQLVRHHESHNP